MLRILRHGVIAAQNQRSPRRRASYFALTISIEIGDCAPTHGCGRLPAQFAAALSVGPDTKTGGQEFAFAVTIDIGRIRWTIWWRGQLQFPLNSAGPQIAANEF